jgi:hypothetical protein
MQVASERYELRALLSTRLVRPRGDAAMIDDPAIGDRLRERSVGEKAKF